MKSFSKFYFKKFEFNSSNLEAKFFYCFDNNVFFEEIIYFDCKLFEVRKNLDLDFIKNILFNIHIALWISYYKLFPTEQLIVESGFLSDFQINFWKKFYLNWLWEFLFTNKIEPKWLFNFICKSDKKYFKKDFDFKNRALVSIWWWKDSIVSIELLKKNNLNFDLFVFWKNDELKKNTGKVAKKNILLINRQISKILFKLNKQWYYNWHIPITWLIAFVKILTWYLYNYKYLILSNEKSANFWNTSWKWLVINHQYSKSLEFEKDFKEYLTKYISWGIKYFSLLRWMYETKIAEIFYNLWKKYFKYFWSCNWNFKINWVIYKKYWCNNCSKCVFIFCILRPFLNKKEVIQIFWEDLFENKNLENIFRELWWMSWIKPLECVWTNEEVIYSISKSLDKYCLSRLPFILNIFKKEISINYDNKKLLNIEKKLEQIYNEDIIPFEIKALIYNK